MGERKRPPCIDFYYDDFSAGVAAMHPCAVGIYIKTICFQWGHDLIPEDAETLQRIAGCSPQDFNEHWPAVREKFVEVEGGGLINERAQASMDKKVRISGKRSEAGKKGSRPSKSKRVSKTQSKTKAQGSRKKEVGSNVIEELSASFADFWKVFPRGRKKSKAKALEAWEKAIALEGVDVELLIRRAAEYAGSDEGQGQYVKMPSTWLNQQCWQDDDFSWKEHTDADRPGGSIRSSGRIHNTKWGPNGPAGNESTGGDA